MVESDDIKEVVNQVAVQVAMVVMMVLRDTEAGPQPTTTASHREPQKQRYTGPILVKLVSDLDTQDRYVNC